MVDALARGVDRVTHLAQLVERRVGALLLQPQALAQHFLQGVADRVGITAHAPWVHDPVEFGASGAQPLFQAVSGIQQLAKHALPSAAAAQQQAQDSGKDGDGQQSEGQGHDAQARWTRPQSAVGACRGQILPPRKGLRGGGDLTGVGPILNIPRLMSTDVPETLDAWRMVAARRGFEGRLPLSSMTRLRDALFDSQGEVSFALDFDRDALLVPYVELRIDAELPLLCQRSLQRFLFPVQIVQRLGLIRAGQENDEVEEAALPPGYEALLVAEDGMLRPTELIEDELILAVPVVPVMPGSEAVERDWPVSADEEARVNPFSALAGLKKH